MHRVKARQASHVDFGVGSVSAIKYLRIVWVAVVLWYELGIFFWHVCRCSWPDQAFVSRAAADDRQYNSISPFVHVLLIADPQILDENSYPERGRFLSFLTQVVVDTNMRKSWWAIRRRLLVRRNGGENAVVFLGDMMDNGRNEYTDAEYLKYYNRFKSIFSTDHSTKIYYIPGNHDVGLGTSRKFSPQSRARYMEHFGPLNYKVSLANHTLVMIDAPGLVEEDYRRSSSNQRFEDWTSPPGGVIDFVKKFASVGSDEPVILLSHIPLFRPDTASCGPLRERGTIRRGVGFGYQNTLGRQTSDYILKNIGPSAIFSGDDHDYCEYTHSVPLVSEGPEAMIDYVHEVTVKSLSMVMGIRNPGFQLLSLADPSSLASGSPSHADAPCILPDQLGIYITRYLPLFLLSLCVLAISTFRRLREQGRYGGGGLYSIQVDSSEAGGSSIRTSPESTFGGPLSATRMFSTTASGAAAGPAPTYRASSATFPGTPYTPDFSVSARPIPGGARVSALGGLFSAPPAGLTVVPGDVEAGYTHDYGEEGDEGSQYAERRVGLGLLRDDYAKPLDRAPARRKRRVCSWSWTFVLRGRRRRMTIGVPHFLEFALVRLWGLCVRGGSREYSRSSRKRKNGYDDTYNFSSTRSGLEGAARVFVNRLVGTAWPPVLVFALVNFYIFL